MPKVSNKVFRQITWLLSSVLNLDNVAEFEDEQKLFSKPPDQWEDIERQLCDYQARIESDLLKGLKHIFKREDADAAD